jgi:hypothetical protein
MSVALSVAVELALKRIDQPQKMTAVQVEAASQANLAVC